MQIFDFLKIIIIIILTFFFSIPDSPKILVLFPPLPPLIKSENKSSINTDTGTPLLGCLSLGGKYWKRGASLKNE